MTIRILLADDHDIVRAGLKSLLERQQDIEIVGEAADGREVVRLAEQLNPSIVVMDIAMPQLNGIDAAAQILRRDPDIRIVILSMYADEEFIVRALTAVVVASSKSALGMTMNGSLPPSSKTVFLI